MHKCEVCELQVCGEDVQNGTTYALQIRNAVLKNNLRSFELRFLFYNVLKRYKHFKFKKGLRKKL